MSEKKSNLQSLGKDEISRRVNGYTIEEDGAGDAKKPIKIPGLSGVLVEVITIKEERIVGTCITPPHPKASTVFPVTLDRGGIIDSLPAVLVHDIHKYTPPPPEKPADAPGAP